LRGRALGNNLNLADAPDILAEQPMPAKGIVKLYLDLEHQPSSVKPALTFKTEAKPTLGPILKSLSGRFSPVRSECSRFLTFLISIISKENNDRIYVHEDDSWSIKGRFSDALEDDEEVSWVTEKGQLTLVLCAEGNDGFGKPKASHGLSGFSHVQGGSAPALVPPVSKIVSEGLSNSELIALLDVPENLARPMRNAGLRINYAKYKACLQAQEVLNQKLKDNTWPQGVKKPAASDIIKLFVSRSQWHEYMTPAFSNINDFPIIKDWLEDTEDSPSDADVWGLSKATYNFSDLQREKDRRTAKLGKAMTPAPEAGRRKASHKGKEREDEETASIDVKMKKSVSKGKQKEQEGVGKSGDKKNKKRAK
jgi:hypothetical protein